MGKQLERVVSCYVEVQASDSKFNDEEKQLLKEQVVDYVVNEILDERQKELEVEAERCYKQKEKEEHWKTVKSLIYESGILAILVGFMVNFWTESINSFRATLNFPFSSSGFWGCLAAFAAFGFFLFKFLNEFYQLYSNREK